MGVVYLAEHPVIGKKVAMKAIHPELSKNSDVVSRFITEAKAVNQIGHEHIVDIADFGNTSDGEFYFVMEYLQGESLSDRLKREKRIPLGQAMSISAQIADALNASHQQGIIHRDLKPENIFLCHPRREPRVRQGARLRAGEADPERPEGDAQDPHRLGDGNAVLHVPRAVRGEDRDRLPRRHLLAGRVDLRDADRQGPVRRRGLRRDHRQARDDAAAVGPQRGPRAAGVHGLDHVSGPGQGSRPALPDDGRPARGAARSRALRELCARRRHPRRPLGDRARRGPDGARRAGGPFRARTPLADPDAATDRRDAVGPGRADREHRQPDPDQAGEPPRAAAGDWPRRRSPCSRCSAIAATRAARSRRRACRSIPRPFA